MNNLKVFVDCGVNVLDECNTNQIYENRSSLRIEVEEDVARCLAHQSHRVLESDIDSTIVKCTPARPTGVARVTHVAHVVTYNTIRSTSM